MKPCCLQHKTLLFTLTQGAEQLVLPLILSGLIII